MGQALAGKKIALYFASTNSDVQSSFAKWLEAAGATIMIFRCLDADLIVVDTSDTYLVELFRDTPASKLLGVTTAQVIDPTIVMSLGVGRLITAGRKCDRYTFMNTVNWMLGIT